MLKHEHILGSECISTHVLLAGEGGADTMAPLRNLFMGMPPMLDALAQQTNVQLPSFLPQVEVWEKRH